MSLATDTAPVDKGGAAAHLNEALTHRGPGVAPVPDRSRGERRTSYDPADFPGPTGREEDWRFTPLDRLRGLLEAPRFDGLVLASASGGTTATLDVVAADDARLGVGARPGDRAAALAHAGAAEVALVEVPAETVGTAPLVVDLVGTGIEHPAARRIVIRAGRFATGTVVLACAGPTTLSDHVEVVAEDGAQLTVIVLHEWDPGSVHLSQHDVHVGRDATVRHIAVTLGGSLVRVCTNATYGGPGGTFEGLGVYFADEGQHLEHRLFVDHAVPRCTSNVVYKGALQGATAHTVWVGDVLIRAEAEGTDTYELNRNLVLTEGARADSVPNLEIETGQIVGAGHASATGRFDDEQLFYLMSRGIPEHEARRLVVRAFFGEIIARIGVSEVVDRLMAVIDSELETAMGGPAGAEPEGAR